MRVELDEAKKGKGEAGSMKRSKEDERRIQAKTRLLFRQMGREDSEQCGQRKQGKLTKQTEAPQPKSCPARPFTLVSDKARSRLAHGRTARGKVEQDERAALARSSCSTLPALLLASSPSHHRAFPSRIHAVRVSVVSSRPPPYQQPALTAQPGREGRACSPTPASFIDLSADAMIRCCASSRSSMPGAKRRRRAPRVAERSLETVQMCMPLDFS
eukprot:5185464-Pleurochrysis_carterae.AAC.5